MITEWVRIYSLTGRRFSIDRVEVSGGLSAVAADGLPPHGLYRLDTPVKEAGNQSAIVAFHVCGEGGEKHTIKLVLRYEGQTN